MLFRSELVKATWDSWVYWHQGTYYLYYLISEEHPGDGFGVATSRDGVKWHEQGWAIRASERMVRYLGSGSVWESLGSAAADRFLCSYSEWREEGDWQVQNMLFARSDDLIHWRKCGDVLMFKIDERFYKRTEEGARWDWQNPRWDGMNVVPRPEGGYYGYWTANPKGFLGFGFGESDDGLHWRSLPPPSIEWGDAPQFHFVEVGGVHEFDGRYYCMVGDYASGHCGMFTLVADSPFGPFRPSARNLCLLGNQSRMHAYFSRFFDGPDGVLVNHHSLAVGQFSDDQFVSYIAPFKRAQIIDGTLYLAWWNGNEKLKNREVDLGAPGGELSFDASRGSVLEGVLDPPSSLRISCVGDAGAEIRVSREGVTEIGTLRADGMGFTLEEKVDREIDLGARPRFRLLLNQTMIEFYLNDLLIQCYTLAQVPDGELACDGAGSLRLWQWE